MMGVPDLPALFVVRHGKSSWADAGQDDFERPLKGRGRKDAAALARLMLSAGLVPDLVLCSSALRARETWEAMREEWDELAPECRVLDELYLATPAAIDAALREQLDGQQRVMVVGHNPGLERLVGLRCGAPVFMKTAHLAVLCAETPEGSPLSARRLALFVRGKEARASEKG